MLTEQHVRTLLDANAPETQTLEFKAQIPGRSDRDKAEFLKDVSAMANASGGTILYGISEIAGAANGISGETIDDPDAEKRRLAQILESGIEPRLSGISLEVLKLAEGDLLALNIPESFDGPHRFTANEKSKFVMRSGTHTSELNFEQLRSAFSRSSKRLEQIRGQWHRDLSLKSGWKPLISGPVCIVRLSPVISADGRQVIDPKTASEHWASLIFENWWGGSHAFNYHGLVVYPEGAEPLKGYAQVYRAGAITIYLTAGTNFNGQNIIVSKVIGNFILEAIQKSLAFLTKQGVRGGAILNVGLTELTGFSLAMSSGRYDNEFIPSAQNVIELPEVWIEDIDAVEVIDPLLRPGFDLIWQSYGRRECPHFDNDNKWTAR